MTRALIAIAALSLLMGALAGPARAAGVPTLTETAVSPKFPARSFVLHLPTERAVTRSTIEVTENGEPVRDLKVSSSAAAGSAIVLAIDASLSMRGEPIVDAMEAARAFAARRRSDQKFGVIFFGGEPTVALEPTADQAGIDAVLAAPPPLSRGTEVYDATRAALDLLKDAKAGAGSVVVLSDGADTGSTVSVDAVADAAEDTRIKLYAVGLRSKRFDPRGLEALAVNGEYRTAESSAQLKPILESLGRRIGNEYLLTYRSVSPLDTRVAVTVAVAGLERSAVLAYETPHLDLRVHRPDRAADSAWSSTTGVSIAVAAIALLLLLGFYSLLRPRKRSVGERVEGFVGTSAEQSLGRDIVAPVAALQRVDARLDRAARWRHFKLDLELAGVHVPPIRLLLFTLTGTVALMAALAGVLGRPIVALLALALPIAVRGGACFRAERVRRAFAEQLPDNLQVLAAALRAGHSFTGGLKVMCDDAAEPSRSEFGRVVGDDQLGVSIEDSLNIVADRMRNDDVNYIGLIATIQRDTGGNTAEVLDRVTGTVRERAQLRRLIKTLTAQGRLGGWIVTLLPVGLVGFLTLVQPDYLEPMLESPTGRLALGLGVMCLLIGAFVIRRIVDIKV